MNLQPPAKVRKLQETLHAKAKEAPDYRFYALYDKVWRADVLEHAYRCCKANDGAAGVDGQTFADIEQYGRERWLGELAETLRRKSYRPDPVKRVWLKKQDGKLRPLGIPTIRDRVVQTAAVLVLTPIIEADLPDEQYGYRPNRSALDAVKAVHTLVNAGHTNVVDADLSGYFDTIPHAELMKSVSRRVSDRWMLHLIKQWLETPVEETDDRGDTRRTTHNKDSGRGCPQGAPISPLLANLYMRRFILGWKQRGLEQRLRAHIVNYADDFVICCRGSAEDASRAMRQIMERLKLTVNERKTRICHAPEERFDFLGYTIGRLWSPRTGRPYIGVRPSARKVQQLCEKISDMTMRDSTYKPVELLVKEINDCLRGWSNYFRCGTVSAAHASVDSHVRYRVRQWLRRKHQLHTSASARWTDAILHDTYGLMKLTRTRPGSPWAKA